jgi:hypothetical protein
MGGIKPKDGIHKNILYFFGNPSLACRYHVGGRDPSAYLFGVGRVRYYGKVDFLPEFLPDHLGQPL